MERDSSVAPVLQKLPNMNMEKEHLCGTSVSTIVGKPLEEVDAYDALRVNSRTQKSMPRVPDHLAQLLTRCLHINSPAEEKAHPFPGLKRTYFSIFFSSTYNFHISVKKYNKARS